MNTSKQINSKQVTMKQYDYGDSFITPHTSSHNTTCWFHKKTKVGRDVTSILRNQKTENAYMLLPFTNTEDDISENNFWQIEGTQSAFIF